MKKLTHILAVSVLAISAVTAANAKIASTDYVDAVDIKKQDISNMVTGSTYTDGDTTHYPSIATAQAIANAAAGNNSVAKNQSKNNASKVLVVGSEGDVEPEFVAYDNLDSGVQASLDLADSALQKLTTGTATGSGNVVTSVTAAADGTVTADKGFTAASQSDHNTLAGRVTTAEGKITTAEGKIEALETKVGSNNVSTELGKKVDKDTNDAQDSGKTWVLNAQGKGSYAKITTSNIADNAAIAKTQLASGVQTSLGKADSALQKNGTLTAGHLVTTNASGEIIDGGVLGSAAHSATTDFATSGQGTKADNADSAISGAVTTAAGITTEGNGGKLVKASALGSLAGKSTVTSSEITDGTIQNADIKDSTIEKGKLASAVQTSLGKADSALQKNGTLTAGHLVTTNASGEIIDGGVLGSAAHSATTDFATSGQGTKADNALPKATYDSQVGTTVDKTSLGSSSATTVVGAIKEINDSAVMQSGITSTKVGKYEAAVTTANAAIPKPTGACADTTNGCSLVFIKKSGDTEAKYYWEEIGR